MRISISSEALIKSLCGLKRRLYFESIPEAICQEALEENPWFSRFYIARSLQAIRTWLNEASLRRLMKNYDFSSEAKRIGIITAGNLPLVGFHDVMLTLLCGHIAVIRCSHQDRILMKWILSEWTALLPELKDGICFEESLTEIDFLLATGSNNTARYLHHQYLSTPRLVRKNRFSIALLTGGESPESLTRLCDDILLYNGLGCRNVSNLLVTPGFDIEDLIEALDSYDSNRLTAQYREKLTWERTRLELLNVPFRDTKHVLIKYSNALDFARMGIIYLIRVRTIIEAEEMIESYRPHIQCIVNKNTLAGKSQTPAVDEFADGVDTLKLFSALA